MSRTVIAPARLAMLATTMAVLLLAACGGSGGGQREAPTPLPTLAPSAPTTQPAVTPSPAAVTPLASPAAVSASPVAATGRPMTRAEFQKQLLAKYPMSQPANRGGTVVLGEPGDISTLNGILANDETTLTMVGLIFEPLIGFSPVDGQPVPGLADSWDVSPDGLTYTFHLNQQAKWHDGVDFTADDVKFSFDAVLDPNTGSSYTTTVNDAVASYRVIDPDTFEITARDRLVTFYFDAPGAVLIMPKHIWENVGFESWTFDGGSTGQDPSRVVGTGPFKFKEWVQSDHVSVVRNDAYYDVIPVIDQFTMQVTPDADSATLKLKQGEIDMIRIIPADQTAGVQQTAGLHVAIYDVFQFTFYGMNLDPTRTPLFQDQQVRQALFVALDRKSITDNIFFGFGEPAIGTQPRISPAYAPDRMKPDYAFDPAQAKQLLAVAGWTDTNGNGTVDKDGVEFKFRLVYGSGDQTVDALVAYMQQAWKDVGVDMEPDGIDSEVWLDQLRAHDFDMTLLAVNFTPDGSQGPFFTCDAYKNGFNFWKYCNPQYDALDEQQRREFDPAARTELLIQQSQIIWHDQPVGPIRFGVYRTGYTDRLHNFYPNGFGLLWSLTYVWIDAA